MPLFKCDIIRTYKSGDTASVIVEAANNKQAEEQALEQAKTDDALRWDFGRADSVGYDSYDVASAQVQP